MAASILPFFRRTVWNGSPFRLPWYHPTLEQLTCTQALQGRHGYSSSSSSKEGKKLDKASAGKATVAKEGAADSTRALQKAVDALLSLGCPQQDVRRIVDKKRSVLIRGYKHILPKAAFFQSHGVNSHDFFNALERTSLHGNFLLTPDETQEGVIEFLRNTVKVTNLGKVIGKMTDRAETLEAKARLWKELGVPVTGALLESYPTMLSYSPETIKEGVEAVRSTFPEAGEDVLVLFPSIVRKKGHHLKDVLAGLEGIFGPDRAQKVLQNNRCILSVPRDTMDNTYRQLKQHFGDLPALKMVNVEPLLLGRPWDSIKSKIDFFLTEMGRSKEEIYMNPSILQFSVERRLKPRYRALVEAGIDHKKFSLWSLIFSKNAAFVEKFKVDLIPQQISSSSSSSSSSKEEKELDKASAGRATVAKQKAANSARALRGAVDALLSLGCTQQQVHRIVDKKKSDLIRGYKHILLKAAFFQSHGVNSHDFFNALERSSWHSSFLVAPDEKQERVIEFLRNTVKVKNLGKVIGKMPEILADSVQTLEAKARLFKELGVPVTGAMLESYPKILCYSLETIKEGVEAVRSTFPFEAGRNVLVLFPSIVRTKGHLFKDVVAGLEGIFGRDGAQKVLQSNPKMLVEPWDTMDNTYKHLKQHFGDLPALKMVKVQPLMLSRSWDSTKSKIDFVLTEMGRSKEELHINPYILRLSLEERLKPRYRALVEAGIDHKEFSLRVLFKGTDGAFMKKFKLKSIR